MFKTKRNNVITSDYQLDKPLAIIAGSGELPNLLLQARGEQNTHIIAIIGQTPEIITQQYPHKWLNIGEVGALFDYLYEHNIQQIVMAGRIVRPSLTAIKADLQGKQLLKQLGLSLFKGDDGLLSTIINFFEKHHINVLGAHQICADLLADLGCMTISQPNASNNQDINIGMGLLQAISCFDVGQAVVLQNGAVLGIEGLEGTAKLLERAFGLQHQIEKRPTLIKLPKLSQELRADMPTIGIETINDLHQYGFAGVCLAAGKTLMLNKQTMINLANELGIFIVGVKI